MPRGLRLPGPPRGAGERVRIRVRVSIEHRLQKHSRTVAGLAQRRRRSAEGAFPPYAVHEGVHGGAHGQRERTVKAERGTESEARGRARRRGGNGGVVGGDGDGGGGGGGGGGE